MHAPAATSVSADPLTVQTEVVPDAKLTGNPDVDVAEMAGGATPIVWGAGALNVTVCGSKVAGLIVKLRETVAAGE